MTTKFVADGIWKSISTAARRTRNPVYAAVAYFGQGASRLLPLPNKSRLVVDASERSVKAGLTCPLDLKKLQRRGVRIYTAQNLHAKIYVFNRDAFIGSANASNRSAGTLIEAMVRTNEPGVVRSARSFVRGLCLDELSSKAIDRLQAIYRPPRNIPGATRKYSGRSIRPKLRRLLLAQTILESVPRKARKAVVDGLRAAATKSHKPTDDLDYIWCDGDCTYRENDKIVQVVKETSKRTLIEPPTDIILKRKWSNGKRHLTFVYFEEPSGRRVRLERLARRLGYGAKKRLQKDGLIRHNIFAERLLAAFGG
jgi:hypothetical protein